MTNNVTPHPKKRTVAVRVRDQVRVPVPCGTLLIPASEFPLFVSLTNAIAARHESRLAPGRGHTDPRMEAQDREWAASPEREPTPFLIWSRKRRAWWAPNRMGYASCLDWAGRYTESEARQIERESAFGPADQRSIAVHEDDAGGFVDREAA